MFSKRFITSLLIEFAPISLFFVGFEVGGFFMGTKLLVLATIASLIAAYVRDRRFAAFPFFVGTFVLLLGGATIIADDPIWIQLEYTLYNATLAGGLFGGLLLGRLVLKELFSTLFLITDEGWRILTYRWIFWLCATALINEFMRTLHPTDVWAYFRFSSAIISTLFGISQIWLVRRERLPEASAWGFRL